MTDFARAGEVAAEIAAGWNVEAGPELWITIRIPAAGDEAKRRPTGVRYWRGRRNRRSSCALLYEGRQTADARLEALSKGSRKRACVQTNWVRRTERWEGGSVSTKQH